MGRSGSAADPATYATINSAWKRTCALLLGEEIGELQDYQTWLKELIYQNDHKLSALSGKGVATSIKEYSNHSKFISFDEVDFGKKFPPLNINEIKDIDSIVEAIEDRIYYCGNILLGNYRNVEQSTNISDGFFVFDSSEFFNVQHIAYCTVGRENHYCFGSHAVGGSEFVIRCCQTTWVNRSFELWVSTNSSDCYYVYGLDDCSDCLFSFNLKNKRHCIGNLEIERDKFNIIKKNLLSEIVEELRRKKSAPSLLDIVRKSKPEGMLKPVIVKEDGANDTQIIEKKFSNTTKLIFGKSLSGINRYKPWLFKHVRKIQETNSAISGAKILWLPYGVSLLPLPDGRAVTTGEAQLAGELLKMKATEVESISLKNAHERIGKIAYFKLDVREGENKNLIDCTFCVQCSHCYNVSMMVRSKYCSCGMWPKDSSDCFGFDSLMNSCFCIKCYHSTNLTRCFEMDSCRFCADSMFCHNCENAHDSMFCFNGKNLRYSIGNSQLTADQYKKIKGTVLEQVNEELEKSHGVPWSIYAIPGR